MLLKTVLCDRCHAELTVEARPSPISNDVLSSMYIPSDSEISQIQPLIQSAECDLHLYDVEIARLSENLATLQRQRDELQDYRDRYRGVISSVRKVPVEILTEIFSWCCGIGLLVDDDGVQATPFALSQTCSFWRAIVRDTPKLWSSLSLNLGYLNDNPGIERLVDYYLQYSDLHPLTLDISAFYVGGGVGAVGDYMDSEDLNPRAWFILQSLLNEGSRWLTVSFDLGWDIFYHAGKQLYDIWEPPSSHQSILQSLTIEWQNDYEPIYSCFFSILGCAPDMRYLQIRAVDAGFPFFGQWIRRLKILDSLSSLSDALSLLISCSSLQEISFGTGDVEDSDITPASLHTLTELRSLTYNSYSPFDGSKIISSLTLPSLTTLKLSTWDIGHARVHQRTMYQSLRDMIQRSNLRLLVLGLSGGLFVSDWELIDILNLVPTITDLDLDVTSNYPEVLTSRFFQRLCFPTFDATPSADSRNSTALLPQLKSFHLAFREDDFHSLRAFIFEDANRHVSPPLPSPEDIFAVVHSRVSLPSSSSDVELEKMTQFQLSVDLFTETSREWFELFSTVDSRLRGLEREGLHLTLNIVPRWGPGRDGIGIGI